MQMAIATWSGESLPSHATSIQMKTRKSTTAGQVRTDAGTGDRLTEATIGSTSAKSVSSGFTTFHRSPTSALKYANPTHHNAQIPRGTMLRKGLGLPKKPASRISRYTATAAARSTTTGADASAL